MQLQFAWFLLSVLFEVEQARSQDFSWGVPSLPSFPFAFIPPFPFLSPLPFPSPPIPLPYLPPLPSP